MLSDVRVVKLLMTNFILEPVECAIAIYKLSTAATAGEKTLGCNGNNYWEQPMERARLIGEHVEQFYLNYALRVRQFEESLEKESSTATDPITGQLLDLFERDKYPINMNLGDFMYKSEQAAAAAALAKANEPKKRYGASTKAALPSSKPEVAKKGTCVIAFDVASLIVFIHWFYKPRVKLICLFFGFAP